MAKKFPDAGPTFTSVEHLPGALKLHFRHTDGGLVVKGDQLAEFSIAGKDRKWHWADAKVAGDSVIVSSARGARAASGPLCLASQPGGDSVQRGGVARGPIPHRRLAGNNRESEALLEPQGLCGVSREWVAFRTSGTEPLVRCYIEAKSKVNFKKRQTTCRELLAV